jgi:hypothetical protein
MKTKNKVEKKAKKEVKKEESHENDRDNAKRIRGVKSTAMVDKKDNYEKKPSENLKKKRGTSDGHMVR